MVYFKNLLDMEKAIARAIHRIGGRYDLIVGVPRSGMIAASRIAAGLSLPLTDLDGFLGGRTFCSGFRGTSSARGDGLRVLVVDDSVCSGREINRVRSEVNRSGKGGLVDYCAVFVAPNATDCVDIYFEICPLPRIFSWNCLNHSLLAEACVDLDGVFCRDPSAEENDDGNRYLDFIENVDPVVVPRYEIGAIVTARLEKYRAPTEKWLQRHGFTYKNLIMLDLPSAAERRKKGIHARFKGQVFRDAKWASFFLESSTLQARAIANVGRKPVVCIEDQHLYLPAVGPLTEGLFKKALRRCLEKLPRCPAALYERLLGWNRW